MTEPSDTPTRGPTGVAPAWLVGILRSAAIVLALGVAFAWFGVYNTGAFPFPERVAYWTGLMAVGAGAAAIVSPLVFERWMATSHPAVQITLVAAIISIPVTLGLVVIDAASDGTVEPLSWWWMQYFYVMVVSLILTTGGWGLDRLTEKKAARAPGSGASVAPAAAPAFAERLPVKYRTAAIYAVSAEDHYLRIHTSAGETMILMRLADAIRELAAVEGMQTHRSWWVARQGLVETSKGDGKVVLKLKSGAEAPVSRTYLKAAKDAGWL